jgi:hypothetical protein
VTPAVAEVSGSGPVYEGSRLHEEVLALAAAVEKFSFEPVRPGGWSRKTTPRSSV